MKAIVCEMCSGNDFSKVDGMFVCQNCGTKYSSEEAKKLMIELSGTVNVKVDKTEDTEKCIELARKAWLSKDYVNAERYYRTVLENNPNSWEACFYSVLSRASMCKVKDIASSCVLVKNNHENVYKLIKANLTGAEEERAVRAVSSDVIVFARTMHNAACNYFNGIGSSIKDQSRSEVGQMISEAVRVMYTDGTMIRLYYKDTPLEKLCVDGFRWAIKYNNLLASIAYIPFDMDVLMPIFEKYDPEYAATLKNSEGSGLSMETASKAIWIIAAIVAVVCVIWIISIAN